VQDDDTCDVLTRVWLQAKASGNKKQKEVAGEVIRHIKLEISSLGIKEADIHQLIAQHFKSEEPKAGSSAPARKDTPAPTETSETSTSGDLPQCDTP
jgi:hypothetical protein